MFEFYHDLGHVADVAARNAEHKSGWAINQFLPRCIQCRRRITMRILSVCHTRVLWQDGRKICPDFYTIRKLI